MTNRGQRRNKCRAAIRPKRVDFVPRSPINSFHSWVPYRNWHVVGPTARPAYRRCPRLVRTHHRGRESPSDVREPRPPTNPGLIAYSPFRRFADLPTDHPAHDLIRVRSLRRGLTDLLPTSQHDDSVAHGKDVDQIMGNKNHSDTALF